jgi:hypothetical protein
VLANVVVHTTTDAAWASSGPPGPCYRTAGFMTTAKWGICGSTTGAKVLHNEIDHNNFLGVKATWGGGGGKLADSVNVTVSKQQRP